MFEVVDALGSSVVLEDVTCVTACVLLTSFDTQDDKFDTKSKLTDFRLNVWRHCKLTLANAGFCTVFGDMV